MTYEQQKNSNSSNADIIIGTTQATQYYCVQQDEPISGVTTCQWNNVRFVVQLQSGIDSKSGCKYFTIDPFEHTPFFNKDDTYGDNEVFKIYNSTSIVDYGFNKAFSNNNLQGDERAVACTGFYLRENGHQFCIVIHPSEVNLIKFCQTNNWNYKKLK